MKPDKKPLNYHRNGGAGMINDKEFYDKEFFVYKAFGGLMALAASVAADCPADFAECVKAWNPDKIADIIEALEEERRKING